MKRTTTRMLPLLLVALLALVVAGCGGGAAEVVPPPGDAVAPTPAPTDPANPGLGVGDPGSADATGADGNGGGAAGDATVPDLEGGESSTTLPTLIGSSIFSAQAVEDAESLDTKDVVPDVPKDEPAIDLGTEESTTTSTTETQTQEIKVSYTGATIYLNGQTIDVKRNGTFPTGAPIFRLLSVSSSDIEIELIAGKFVTNNGSGLFLDRGKLLTLANQSEQMTYRIKYLRPIAASSDPAY